MCFNNSRTREKSLMCLVLMYYVEISLGKVKCMVVKGRTHGVLKTATASRILTQ